MLGEVGIVGEDSNSVSVSQVAAKTPSSSVSWSSIKAFAEPVDFLFESPFPPTPLPALLLRIEVPFWFLALEPTMAHLAMVPARTLRYFFLFFDSHGFVDFLPLHTIVLVTLVLLALGMRQIRVSGAIVLSFANIRAVANCDDAKFTREKGGS